MFVSKNDYDKLVKEVEEQKRVSIELMNEVANLSFRLRKLETREMEREEDDSKYFG